MPGERQPAIDEFGHLRGRREAGPEEGDAALPGERANLGSIFGVEPQNQCRGYCKRERQEPFECFDGPTAEVEHNNRTRRAGGGEQQVGGSSGLPPSDRPIVKPGAELPRPVPPAFVSHDKQAMHPKGNPNCST